MVPDTPESTSAPGNGVDSPIGTDSPTGTNTPALPGPPPLETVTLEELGAGSDRSAGSPESWEIEPEGGQPSSEDSQPNPDNPGVFSRSGGPQSSSDERFNVKLDIFEGPLELLLHLLREHKLDIYDIPISFITEQYLKYIDMMKLLNINIASDYLVMAAWLVYIKSRTLLPQTEGEEEEEEDPEALRLELQRQLLEYQKFKSLSQVFRQAEEDQSGIFPRGGNGDGILLDPADDPAPPPMEVTVFDLITAIQKMIEEAGEEGVHLIEVDELEVADRETFILDLLEKAGPEGVEFHKLFEGEGPRRLLIVVTFLALLELVRLNLILTAQSALFEEIRITRAVNDDD